MQSLAKYGTFGRSQLICQKLEEGENQDEKHRKKAKKTKKTEEDRRRKLKKTLPQMDEERHLNLMKKKKFPNHRWSRGNKEEKKLGSRKEESPKYSNKYYNLVNR